MKYLANTKVRLVAAGLILLVVVIFSLFIPISTQRVVSEENCGQSSCAATCIGYNTDDGLKPDTDFYKRHHILLGELFVHRDYIQRQMSDDSMCAGGLEVTEVQLFL